MKQYVLEEPVAAAAPPVEPQALPRMQPGWWRWLVLAILLEAVALAILYVALNGVPGARRAEPSPGIAYVASFSFPREAEAAQASAHAQPAEAAVSRIRQEHGRYLVDLHDEAPAAAMEMLAQATKARVAGTNIFSGSALRLTRSVVATSPREAWQAVFGDVANFAIACTGSACEVRFVSLAKSGATVPGSASLQGGFSRAEPAITPAVAPPAQAPVNQAAAAAQPILDGDGVPVEN
jgi:hypothetical protein